MTLREPGAEVKSERVAKLAGSVAATMGLSVKAASVVELAASVMDVGRLAVPEAVLAQSGPLTTQEWQQMSGHMVAAEALLLKIPELRALAPVVRATHERWDGGGYPDGEVGESIPLPSRIIAACDAFVAMTSDRAFRRALDEVTAIQQVKEMAGSQLDPSVAKALVAQLSGHKIPHNGSASGSGVSAPNRIDAKDLMAKLDVLKPLQRC